MSVENNNGLDQDALNTLTPEELAAINDPEMSPEEIAAMKVVAGDDDDDSDDDDELAAEVADPAKEGPEPAAAKEAAAEPAPQDKAQEKPVEKSGGAEFVPRFTADLPEDFAAQMDGIKNDARALAQKYKDGEIDFDAYSDELDQINARREALNKLQVKAEIAQDMTAQTEEQRWVFSVNRFCDSVAEKEKIDYRADAAKQADLDQFVKVLSANPANANQSYDWFLSEAHKRVKALHGIADPAPPAKDETKPTAPASRKPPVADLPKTLAHVPGGEGPGDVAGEFASLDSLEGIELESAIAAMTPAQRERYMRGD